MTDNADLIYHRLPYYYTLIHEEELYNEIVIYD